VHITSPNTLHKKGQGMEQKHLDMTQFGCTWLDLQHEKIPHHELNGLIPFLLSTLLDPTEGNSVLDLHILNFC
jgi:hypothetical protein